MPGPDPSAPRYQPYISSPARSRAKQVPISRCPKSPAQAGSVPRTPQSKVPSTRQRPRVPKATSALLSCSPVSTHQHGSHLKCPPPLLQPHVPPHPSAPGWGQRTGTGLSTGDRGCPAMGAQLGVPTSRERACPLRAQHVPRRGTAPSPAGAAPQAAGLRPKLLPQQTPCEATNPAAAAAATAAPPNLGQGCESRTPGVTQRRRGSAGERPGRAAGSLGATPGTARGQGWGCPRGMEGTRARCSPARLQAGFGPTGHVERILQVFLVGSSGCWPQKPDCRPRVTAAGEGQESEGTAKPLL